MLKTVCDDYSVTSHGQDDSTGKAADREDSGLGIEKAKYDPATLAARGWRGDNWAMEDDLLRWFRETLPTHKQVLLGAGDDAAVLKLLAGANVVATTDMLMDGVDFRLSEHDPILIGRKALAVNLSDLAAMAARPVAALVSLALPENGGESLTKQLYSGLLPLAKEFDCAIAGGDVNSWNGPLVISITALGEVLPGREWRRSGAQADDIILVTGSFGGSILGKHFSFTPRVEEALFLAEHLEVHAAMDVSDGLSLDLSRLAAASGCGAAVGPQAIPISPAARAIAIQQPGSGTPLNHALADGEDFELILAVPPNEVVRFRRAHPEWTEKLTQIGRFFPGSGLWEITEKAILPLEPRGYQHRLDS
jgi:thiamine-monophosphate kinase